MAKPTYQQVHIDVALTNVSIAYRPGKFIADQVFPPVPVNKQSDRYFIYTKSDWLRREAAPRAMGTRAVRGDYGLTTGGYICLEYAFAKGVPDELVENADNPLRPDIDATQFVTNQIALEYEAQVANIAFGPTWAASATPGVLWSNDTSDPLGDSETAMNTVVGTIGLDANRGVMGRGLWRYAKNHPDIVDRIKYGAGPQSPAAVTVAAVAGLIGVDQLLIGAAINDTAQEGATSALSYLWGNHLLLAYVASAPSLMEPSAGYVFNFKNREVSRFREDQERQDVIEARQNFVAALTATDAGYLIKSAA